MADVSRQDETGPEVVAPESLEPGGDVVAGPPSEPRETPPHRALGHRGGGGSDCRAHRRHRLGATLLAGDSQKPSSREHCPGHLRPGPGGGHYSLAQFRNEWVLVNFMATWCPPCQQEMPQLLKFASQHAKSADATVLTVVYDPTNVSQLKRSWIPEEHVGRRWTTLRPRFPMA